MKKVLCLWICLILMAITHISYAENTIVTYEQIVNGECNGQTIEIEAIPLVIDYYNLRYVWAVKTADGDYEQVSETESRWCVSEDEYNKASSAEKDAFDNQDAFILTVSLREDGRPFVEEFRLPGTMSEDESMSLFFLVMVVLLVLCFVVLIVLGNKKQNDGAPIRRKLPEVVKTKFIDSSHTATSHAKTSSAVGRAAVGGMIAGPFGAIVGASTAKHKTTEHHTTTFMVYYDDGTRKVETVSNGSYQYDKYMRLLDMGD